MSAPTTTGQLLVGDARARLADIPPASVDMVLTSPPYFRLRDYGTPGQLGHEVHVDDWAQAVSAVVSTLRPALKPAGTLWLNLGDSYAAHVRQGAGRKSLLLGPERVARALVADGWLLRNKIVWVKPNPIPTPVRDRLNTAWEYVYVFARSPDYYFDLDALREPHRTAASRGRSSDLQRPAPVEAWRGPNSASRSGLDALKRAGRVGHPGGKNPGDVWTIANPGVPGHHHAVFPIELARRAIMAGCPPGGTVLDPFMGSGTAAVAAEALGRRWIGIELQPDFAAQAKERIHQARASPAA